MPSYRFGPFEVSLTSRELRKNGVLVRLSPQPFQVLALLIERSGNVVTREELQQELWGDDISVEFDAGLNRCIRQIRAALSDNFDVPRYIETVPRRGYRFMPQALLIEPAPPSTNGVPAAFTAVRSDKSLEAPRAPDPPSRPIAKEKASGLPAWWFTLGVAAVLLLAAAIIEYQRAQLSEPKIGFDAVPLANAPGDQWSPTFSPDGRAVAYTWNKDADNRFNIYVKLTGAPNSLRLTSANEVDYGPAWSPDGRWIAFCRGGREPGGAVWIIPALGGPERKIVDLSVIALPEARPLAWSPDSKWLVVADRLAHSTYKGLSLVNVQSGVSSQLTEPVGVEEDMCPSFSPGGAMLSFTRDTGRGVSSIGLLPFAAYSAPLRRVRLLHWDGFESVLSARSAWTPDGKYLVFESNLGGKQNLFLARANGAAQPQPLSALGDNVMAPAFSRQGQLAYVHQTDNVNIWKIALADGGAAIQGPAARLIGSTRNSFTPAVSPAGDRLAFASNQYGPMEIWTSKTGGTDMAQLTSLKNPVTGSPAWSPDGAQIAFDSRADGAPRLYLIGAGGGVPRKLTPANDTGFVPAWSVDGKWIYYSSDRTGTVEVFRVRVSDGVTGQISSGGGFAPAVSPDGVYIYYAQTRAPVSSLWRLTLATKEKKLISSAVVRRAYTPAKNGIYYVRLSPDAKQELCFLDFRSGREMMLARLDGGVESGMSLSRDEHYLYFSKVEHRSHDLMIVENFWRK